MHTLELYLSPKEASSEQLILSRVAAQLHIPVDKIIALKHQKKSIDARRDPVRIRLVTDVFIDETPEKEEPIAYKKVDDSAPRAIIIGCGPAGMYAALRLLESGIKPIIVERGKEVRERRRDLAAINKERVVDEDSNYCFGEGGAGTYSDGKLYTRSKKRGSIAKVLKVFTDHGADDRIRYEAHPHIGTNKLPGIVSAMNETIVKQGGEIHYNSRVNELILDRDQIKGVRCADGSEHRADHVILATGHSARDIFTMLDRQGIAIEAKPFALGVRIEHPQELIDRIQYHCAIKDPDLPPSSYSLVEQVNGRGVFSFCMCPGGIIAPAATAPGEVVVNGWSPSKRNGKFANSGMVVALDDKDFQPYAQHGNLRGMAFQAAIEQRAFLAGGSDLTAPAQRVSDFLEKRISKTLPDTSYIPGIKSVSLDDVLPELVSKRLRGALQVFGKKMKGYSAGDALLVGVESRTSSPVRIPRDHETLEHPQIKGLYPCGEGAGYAGGIVSAAMDGERCAERIAALVGL